VITHLRGDSRRTKSIITKGKIKNLETNLPRCQTKIPLICAGFENRFSVIHVTITEIWSQLGKMKGVKYQNYQQE
jgi:hypothetical protein